MSIVGSIGAKIRRIQRASDTVKRRWQIALTTISMILIILLWLGYVSVTIPKIEGTTPDEDTTESFFSVFGRGFTIISGNAKEKLKDAGASVQGAVGSFQAQIKQGNKYTIEGEK